MTGNEIRKKFLEYFIQRGHREVESSSLVPADDPTLLFTNAGMVQFKRVFMGEDKRDYVRATTSQRCVRAGGKHNDLENVGYTARHHTFFEMLGNFSFGDYFKEEAITFAWDFLTKELKLPTEKLWVTIYEDDDEAEAIWKKVDGLLPGRIVRMGEKDNFWAMGDTGPCGPCSEIHIDQGVEAGCGRPDCKLGCDCDRFLELWNLVFMQYNRSADGTMTPLPKPSIDTGMGIERVAAVLQGKLNNYDSDLFSPLLSSLEEMSGKKYGQDNQIDVAMRVIADHARATTFLVSDGVLPSNEGRGYVLRRIMRRAIRYGQILGFTKPFMSAVTDVVVASMQHAYPHLTNSQELLRRVVVNEEERFLETLEHGLSILDEEIVRLQKAGKNPVTIPGDFIFKLYDTFGFPVDIVRDISLERGIGFDEQGFTLAMEEQRAKSRAAQKGEGLKLRGEGVKELLECALSSQFIGYEEKEVETCVSGLVNDEGVSVAKLACGMTGQMVAPLTPFYAESGGQMGDKGTVLWNGGQAEVHDTVSEGSLILHQVKVLEGELVVGRDIKLTIDRTLRDETASNHTATHLLQAAMRRVLGDHVKQAGSLVGPQRLRFDFTHFSPLTEEEIFQIEDLVNGKVRENIEINTRLLAKDAAVAEGATALFGEKYDDTVRVVTVDGFSKELCGGTHVQATGNIGFFKILSESGIASGVRRIEATTGYDAFLHVDASFKREARLMELLGGGKGEELPGRVEHLLQQQKQLEKQVAQLSRQLAGSGLSEVLDNAVDVNGIKVVAAELTLDSAQTLREMGDKVREKLDSGIAVLGGVVGEKVALLAIVSKDLTGKIKAGDLVNSVAKVVGGKGGGRPDMAQAGGVMTDKLGEAIGSVQEHVRRLLG